MVGVATGIIQIAILTRYLEKSDFAWVAIAGIFVNICIQLQSAGINSALVQIKENSIRVLSSLFWFNLFTGTLLFVIIAFLSFVLAGVYDAPILIPITITYSTVVLFHAFGAQYKVLLQKKMQFDALAMGELVGTAVGFFFVCLGAVQGWRAYAMLAGYISRYIIELIIIIIKGKKLFIPYFLFDYQSVRQYIVFSRFHWAERILVQIAGQIDLLIIGKLLGGEALGVYDLFKRTLVRPFNLASDIVEKTTFPVLVHFQKNTKKQKYLFFQMLSHLSALNLPIVATLIIATKPLISLYFGAEWIDYTYVFQLLCVFCVFHYLLNPIDVLLLAQSKIRLWFYSNVLLLPLQAFVVTVGCQWGLSGATVANLFVFAVFTLFVYFLLVLPNLKSTFKEFTNVVKIPFLITLSSLLPVVIGVFFVPRNSFTFLFLLIFTALYSILTWRFNKSLIAGIQQLIK